MRQRLEDQGRLWVPEYRRPEDIVIEIPEPEASVRDGARKLRRVPSLPSNPAAPLTSPIGSLATSCEMQYVVSRYDWVCQHCLHRVWAVPLYGNYKDTINCPTAKDPVIPIHIGSTRGPFQTPDLARSPCGKVVGHSQSTLIAHGKRVSQRLVRLLRIATSSVLVLIIS